MWLPSSGHRNHPVTTPRRAFRLPCSELAHPFPSARAAGPPAVGLDERVLLRVRVPVGAHFGGRTGTKSHVLSVRERQEMLRVHTQWDLAPVVDVKPRRDGANELLVREPVCLDASPVEGEPPVWGAGSRPGAGPEPAPVRHFDNPSHETFSRCHIAILRRFGLTYLCHLSAASRIFAHVNAAMHPTSP